MIVALITNGRTINWKAKKPTSELFLLLHREKETTTQHHIPENCTPDTLL
jgi:hypothetical protein